MKRWRAVNLAEKMGWCSRNEAISPAALLAAVEDLQFFNIPVAAALQKFPVTPFATSCRIYFVWG